MNWRLLHRSFIFILYLIGFNSAAYSDQVITTDKHWLLNAQDDKQRFQRLEGYLRGFDQPMWEVGERFEKMTSAVDRQNYPLAIYHWKKIKKTILNGLMKRPARSANAKAILLDKNWQAVMDDLQQENPSQALTALNKAATLCMACHAAEKLPFINNQTMFDRFNHQP